MWPHWFPHFLPSMIQKNFPIFKSNDYQIQILITSAKSFLPRKVIYSQAPGMRVWMSLVGCLPSPPDCPLCQADPGSIVPKAIPLSPRMFSSIRPSHRIHLPCLFYSLIWPIVLRGVQISFLWHKHLRSWFSDLEPVGSLSRCLPTGWFCAIIVQCFRKQNLHPGELASTMPCPAPRIWCQQLPESYLSFHSLPTMAPKEALLCYSW